MIRVHPWFSRQFLAVALLLLGTATTVRAQGTELVPLDEQVYHHIDILAASGLIDSLITDQRPYTRREIARLLGEAKTKLAVRGDSTSWLATVAAADLAQFGLRDADASRGMTTRWLRTDGNLMRDPPRAVPNDRAGSIAADVDPLTAYDEGRRYHHGFGLSAESRHVFAPSDRFEMSVQPRVSYAWRAGAPADIGRVEVIAADASLLLGNFVFALGRQPITFGQGRYGGLVLSQNAPGLDALRITNDRPYRLPWIFRYLGPLRGTAFIADLGANQTFPHSKLIGYALSGAIHPRFELSGMIEDEQGGRGAPGAIFRDRLYDTFLIIDALNTHTDYQFSNKFMGIDARWRVPGPLGLIAYGDGMLDDFDTRRLVRSVVDDGGYILGLSATCLGECGRNVLTTEYHKTGMRYLTHAVFTTGFAENRFILGDQLGPRARGAYAWLDHYATMTGVLTLGAAYERRVGNLYDAYSNPDGSNFHFVQTDARPLESRLRGTLEWTNAIGNRGVSARVGAGLERVQHFDNTDQDRWNQLLRIGLEWRP